jgi:prephenate dehydratase
VLHAQKRFESNLKIAFLGPRGTYTEAALLSQADLVGYEQVPLPTIPTVLEAVESGQAAMGLVPIENSIEGTVNLTQDSLVFDFDLLIQREIVVDIKHCILGTDDATLETIRTIHTIPIAASQCYKYIQKNLRGVEVIDSKSTAEAAQIAAQIKSNSVAALASKEAADRYGLKVIASGIADHESNQTRFVLVGKDSVPARTGNDQTGLVVFQDQDKPGSLVSILEEFASRQISLNNLLSRPLKHGGLGNYCFVIYAQGHVADKSVAEVLEELYRKHKFVKFLGSYPQTAEKLPSGRRGKEPSKIAATKWMSEILKLVDS